MLRLTQGRFFLPMGCLAHVLFPRSGEAHLRFSHIFFNISSKLNSACSSRPSGRTAARFNEEKAL